MIKTCILNLLALISLLGGCSLKDQSQAPLGIKMKDLKTPTVQNLDLTKFMGDWYVVAGRTTYFEKGAYNSLEQYTWNEAKQRIDINFSYNKGSLDGPKKVIPQKAWVFNNETNAHWKVQPIWPLKMDYLVLEIDPDYKWTAVGVPNQNYLWIMSREKQMNDELLNSIVKSLDQKNYNTKSIQRIEHR
jgi:apolipoprotein D and lipocalin family protein